MLTITFQPSGTVIQCRADQTITDAAEEQGVDIYVGCENGVCMICQSERISGSFHFRNTLGQQILDQEDKVLCCVANPLTDSELYMSSVQTPDFIEPLTYACQVSRMELIGDDMWRVDLLLPAGKTAKFWPGQYLLLHITHTDGKVEQIPYSIACAPSDLTGEDPRRIELHIASDTERSECIVCSLKDSPIVKVTMPQGECFLNKRILSSYKDQPLILVAAGAGFYINSLPEHWAKSYTNIHYHPIIEQPDANWAGRKGMIYQVISEDFADLTNTQVFACGSPNMVYGTLDQLAKQGLSDKNMHSDVFSYAPRNK